MSWSGAGLPVAVAVAMVFLPGLAIAAAARCRGVVALALAGPLGYAVIGVAGVAAAAFDVPFGWLPIVVTTVVVVVVEIAARALLGALGRPVPGWDSWRPSAWVPVLAAAAAASAMIAVVAFAAVPAPDRFSQTYDAVFHLNAATSILQTGDASSLHLYRLTNPTRDIAFYPAVWHSITALTAQTTGVPVTVAANATWIGTSGPVFALGCALAAAVLFGATGMKRDAVAPAQRTLVAAVAALLASTFVAFPYLLLDFGTLYPNGLAYTILPVGLALVAGLLPWPDRASWRPEAPAPRGRTALLLAGWCAAAAFTHPRSVVAILALTVPLLVAWFGARMAAAADAGPAGRRRARRGWILLAVVGVGGALLALAAVSVYYDTGTRPIADRLNGGPARARETFGQALLQGLLATSLVSPAQVALPPSLVLASLAFGGLILALRRPGLRWVVTTYLLIVLLYALAAGSDSDLAKLATGLWYKDKFRILAMLPTIAAPLVAWTLCIGGAELAAVFRRRRTREAGRTAIAVVVCAGLVVAALAWTGPALRGASGAIGTVFSVPDSAKGGQLVDADLLALLRDVDRFVPEGEVIAGNPWNGSALAWTLGGRRTLFPHLGGYWGPQGGEVKRHLDDWQRRPAVCDAVRALDVHWVITDRGWLRGDRAAARAFVPVGRVDETGGVELVASSGSARLWRLTACWT